MAISIEKIKSYIAEERAALSKANDSAKDGEELLAAVLIMASPADKKRIDDFIDSGAAQKLKLTSYCATLAHDSRAEEVVPLAYHCGVSGSRNLGAKSSQNNYGEDLKCILRFVREHEKDASFGYTVTAFAESKGLKNSEIYRNACLSRQDFSRIVDPKRKSAVKRQMVWSVALGLRLTIDETDVLLYSAGYVRTKTRFDLVLTYCITHGMYNVTEINIILDELGQQLLPQTYSGPVN